MARQKKIKRQQDVERIIKVLDQKHCRYEYNEDGTISVMSCDLSYDNFYDYDEDEPALVIKDKDLRFLANEPNVNIVRCCDCCSCAGW